MTEFNEKAYDKLMKKEGPNQRFQVSELTEELLNQEEEKIKAMPDGAEKERKAEELNKKLCDFTKKYTAISKEMNQLRDQLKAFRN